MSAKSYILKFFRCPKSEFTPELLPAPKINRLIAFTVYVPSVASILVCTPFSCMFDKPEPTVVSTLVVPPSEVIERVKKKIREDMMERTSVIDEIKSSEILSELNLLYTQGVEMVEATDLTASVKGRDNIYDHFQLMFSSATESIHIMTTEEGLIKKAKYFKKSFEK